MIKKVDRNKARCARHTRVRNKVTGTSSVPRLNVFRSNNNIFAQIIDDEASKTLVSASSIDKELKLENGGNTEAAVKVGELLARIVIMDKTSVNKVYDPACGSGAFPMGVLQQMVHVLKRIDPTNEMWNTMMVDIAIEDARKELLKVASGTDEEKQKIENIGNLGV